MRLLSSLLLPGAAVFALPSPQPDLSHRIPITSITDLTLTQPPNLTSPLTTQSYTLCYHSLYSRPVDRQSCIPLINYLASTPDFRLPKLWLVGHERVCYTQGCKLRVVSGRWEDIFSMQDVVVAMERVLEECQPPKHMGVGGSAPVNGRQGFMYAAFQAQVTSPED